MCIFFIPFFLFFLNFFYCNAVSLSNSTRLTRSNIPPFLHTHLFRCWFPFAFLFFFAAVAVVVVAVTVIVVVVVVDDDVALILLTCSVLRVVAAGGAR